MASNGGSLRTGESINDSGGGGGTPHPLEAEGAIWIPFAPKTATTVDVGRHGQ